MNLKEIDYRPLQSLRPLPSFFKAIRQVFSSWTTWAGVILVIGISSIDKASPVIGQIFFLAIIAFLTYIGDKYTRIRKRAWMNFAKTNNWSTCFTSKSHIPPSISELGGRDLSYRTIIIDDILGQEWFLSPYKYVVGGEKNSQTITNVILSTHVSKPMPYIALDNIKNRGGLVTAPEGFEEIKLEGKMHEYFTVLVQKGLYTDALSILSPDVMHVLIEKCKLFDVEIIDDMLYVISVGDNRTIVRIKELLEAGSALVKELEHRAKSLKYSPGKTFEYRAEYHRAITHGNAVYKRSHLLEFRRQSKKLKVAAFVSVSLFLIILLRYIVIDNS